MPGRRTSSEKKKKLKKRSPKLAEEKPAAGPVPSAERRTFTLAQLRGTALLPDAPSSPADRPAAKKPLLPLRLPSDQASPRAAGRGKQVVQDRASLARRAGGGRLRPGSDSNARLQSRSSSLSGPSPLSTTLPCLSSFTSPSTCSPDTGPRLSGSRDSLASSSWAAEVEEELAPPTTYASLLSRSLQGRSPATPTTPPTPYTPGSRDGCCDQDDSFFPASGRLPGYTIHRADLQPGAVWDSHCHLDFLSRKLAREGTRNGEQLEVSLRLDGENLGDRFGGCIANFCDPRDWASGRQGQDITAVLKSCRTQHRVFLAVGCHPHFADRLNGAQLLQLERLAGRLQGRLVAIGECGIDRSRKNDIPMQVQRKSFTAQVRLALKLRLPLVLHIRDAEEEGRAVLREQDVPAEWPIHRHCFNDSWAVAEEWLDLYPGSKIGLTGLVTYGHAAAVHEVARRIPLDRLLLETDAPYFLPAGVSKATYRHRFAQPGHVVHVAAQVQ
jgi:TatD DNase family protein